MRRLGASESVVRTAVSRLAKDGLLEGRRAGRRSAYALTPRGEGEFRAAIPQIYGSPTPPWDGRLRLAFPRSPEQRTAIAAAGYASLAPGVLISPQPITAEAPVLEAAGPPETLQHLAALAWPLPRLADDYKRFTSLVAPLIPIPAAAPIDAMAARTLLLHAWRRIALRDPQLPEPLLPPDWPGTFARHLCKELYATLAAGSEAWLDESSAGNHPLPTGDDPAKRFA